MENQEVIYKYHLAHGETPIELPENSQVLTAQVQVHFICLWVLVPITTCRPVVTRTRVFEVIGTGEVIEKRPRNYVATVQHKGYVWHIFERL